MMKAKITKSPPQTRRKFASDWDIFTTKSFFGSMAGRDGRMCVTVFAGTLNAFWKNSAPGRRRSKGRSAGHCFMRSERNGQGRGTS
ncbi:MAG: hypothetical protein DRI57_02880 [Deltaproteobacteria bacterium]|nr:MAG: hypothetical protein DRI57_02880 [Deltaproteobacteria bacterium]